MVYLEDKGGTFDAPLEFVWKYIYGGESHDEAHKTTRKPTFKKVSDITFEYGSERLLRGKWTPDRMRISMFPPVAVVSEWLEGVLDGSKMVYLYSQQGDKTAIDVYGEFSSKTLAPGEIEPTVREFLDSEFRDDAASVGAAYSKSQAPSR